MVNIKKEKDALLKKADELEKKAESRLLTQREIDLKQTVKDRLAHLLREEEVKWFQRAKTTKLLMGDRNTEYFHAVANGKRRKTRIYRLEQNEGVIEGEENIREYINGYYRKLFGRNAREKRVGGGCAIPPAAALIKAERTSAGELRRRRRVRGEGKVEAAGKR